MARRLIVLFDGTWNKVDTNTNVWRLHELLAPADAAGAAQIALYIAGVGVKRGITHLLGGAFGLGLSGNIEQGYRWLCQQWNPGDEIYLFGFSRGAYSARSAAGMIRKCGLVKPDVTGDVSQHAVDDAYDFYRNDIKPDDPRRWNIGRSDRAKWASASSACGTRSAHWASPMSRRGSRTRAAAIASTTPS